MNSLLRIVHTPDVVGGNPSNLAKGERQLGLDSKLVYFVRSIFDFTSKEDVYVNTHGNIILEYASKSYFLIYILLTKNIIHFNNGKTLFRPPKIICKNDSILRVFIKTLFNFSIGLLHNLDLKLLKLFKKKIYITFQGSDARIHSFHVNNYKISHCHFVGSSEMEFLKDDFKVRYISEVSKYVNQIFAVNPDLLNTLPKGSIFLPYCNVDIQDWTPYKRSKKINKIVHAPSKLDVKGTKYVVLAIEELKKNGFEFEFELVHGVPQNQMKAYLSKADLVIDQLLVGWYGGLSVEAMALGIPVICYLRSEDLIHVPKEMIEDCPIINASPETLYSVLKNTILSSSQEIQILKEKSRYYVEKWHDPKRIAEITLAHYLKEPK